jgi:hypothetical protein
LKERAELPSGRKITHKVPDKTAQDGYRRIIIAENNLPKKAFVGEFICFEGMQKKGNIVPRGAVGMKFFPQGRGQVRIYNRH